MNVNINYVQNILLFKQLQKKNKPNVEKLKLYLSVRLSGMHTCDCLCKLALI
jgi:hypothetical protein